MFRSEALPSSRHRHRRAGHQPCCSPCWRRARGVLQAFYQDLLGFRISALIAEERWPRVLAQT
ncbi:hypothetical protein ACFQ2M_41875 [Kitasatospora saccharophila]|uniref:hypothetical protein n=1 Tax=Kitasatospora saccharophila TaxID=407973 RepID=UPI0036366163